MKFHLKNILTFIKNFFLPQKIAFFHSRFNGQVQVMKFRNELYLQAAGVHQSGGWETKLYNHAFKRFGLEKDGLLLKKVLLLGLGAGSVVKILQEIDCKIDIIGVDIDQAMVAAGKKYFHLQDGAKLKIIIADAEFFVAQEKNQFDLIIFDIFQGDRTPEKFLQLSFLVELARLLPFQGKIIFNLLYLSKQKKQTDEFILNLGKWQPITGLKIDTIYEEIGNKVLLLKKGNGTNHLN